MDRVKSPNKKVLPCNRQRSLSTGEEVKIISKAFSVFQSFFLKLLKIQEIASTTPHFSCNMKMAKIPVITGAEKVNVVASPAGI